jgi:hypothetical protein
VLFESFDRSLTASARLSRFSSRQRVDTILAGFVFGPPAVESLHSCQAQDQPSTGHEQEQSSGRHKSAKRRLTARLPDMICL